jgi:hypothetical protein
LVSLHAAEFAQNHARGGLRFNRHNRAGLVREHAGQPGRSPYDALRRWAINWRIVGSHTRWMRHRMHTSQPSLEKMWTDKYFIEPSARVAA